MSRDSQVRVLKFSSLGLPRLWGPLTFFANLELRRGLKQSCSPRWDLFNSMWNATCTQGNLVDSQLLVVRNQIADLTPSSSFDHNLCFRCPNESCKPILNIYVPRSFQWCNYLNPMRFDPYNCSLNIRESIKIQTLKVRVPLGVWRFIPSHSFALTGAWNVTLRLRSWPALLQALPLVANPRLGLRHMAIMMFKCLGFDTINICHSIFSHNPNICRLNEESEITWNQNSFHVDKTMWLDIIIFIRFGTWSQKNMLKHISFNMIKHINFFFSKQCFVIDHF